MPRIMEKFICCTSIAVERDEAQSDSLNEEYESIKKTFSNYQNQESCDYKTLFKLEDRINESTPNNRQYGKWKALEREIHATALQTIFSENPNISQLNPVLQHFLMGYRNQSYISEVLSTLNQKQIDFEEKPSDYLVLAKRLASQSNSYYFKDDTKKFRMRAYEMMREKVNSLGEAFSAAKLFHRYGALKGSEYFQSLFVEFDGDAKEICEIASWCDQIGKEKIAWMLYSKAIEKNPECQTAKTKIAKLHFEEAEKRM